MKEQTYLGGDVLLWVKPREFVELCMELSLQNMFSAARTDMLTFFDRSYIEGVNYFFNAGVALRPPLEKALTRCRYNQKARAGACARSLRMAIATR